MQLTKQQVETILKNAPLGVDKKKVLDGLIMRGYELEGVDSNSVIQKLQPVQEKSLTERLGDTGEEMTNRVSNAIKGEGQYKDSSLLNRGIGATAAVFSAVPKGALDFAPESVRKSVDYVGDKIGDGFKAVTDKLADTDLIKGAALGDTSGLEDKLGIASGAGEIAGSILSAEGSVKAVNTGKNVAGKVIDKTKQATSNVAENIANTGTKIGGKFENTPANIMQRVARIPKAKQAKFEATAGESVGEYLTRRNIFGNVDEISTKLYERFTKSKNTADEALATLKGTFAPEPVKTMLKDLLDRETRISTPGAPSPILSRVQELARKTEREGWNMSEINEIKRMFERNNTVDYLRQNLPESVAKAKNLDSAVREWQFKQAETLGLKNLKEINKETRLAKQLLDDIGKEYAGSAGNNAISLTDYILLAGGDVTALSSFLLKSGLSSKNIQASIAKYLNKGKEVLGDVKADLGTSQVKQLPAPKAGSPKKQINVPIKQPSRKAIQQGTEIVKKKK